jgi:hypothetical protein
VLPTALASLFTSHEVFVFLILNSASTDAICKMLNTHITVLSLLLLLIPGINALTYKLDASYSGSSFFRGFDFFTVSDNV